MVSIRVAKSPKPRMLTVRVDANGSLIRNSFEPVVCSGPSNSRPSAMKYFTW